MIDIAALKDNTVINKYIYEDKDEAARFYEAGAFGDADGFAEIPDDFNVEIGNVYKDGEFSKPEAEPQTVHTPPEITNAEIIQSIEDLKVDLLIAGVIDVV